MKCSFCGSVVPPGTGKITVKKDGSVLNFCNTKCERNFSMRDPARVKWTAASIKARGKE